ncbi:RIKEN cDNA 8430419L09 [Mus musculus]|uniref:FAM234A/B beta-propeller domain-containing protein n=1 Tax=Mus musculus TaxID=10090 RepID=B2RPZ7_MOUSE|nr:RIKEN cDNA 8430419L09 gene [Mus musculus]AAI37677.1 RIKEN cDNA 8430419L09 gene [Mus musculus]EDL10547.1 RIKEN cDNA 8430419L09 [Mus musculus]
MATVLSRALKLPGKKSPDLGEYDPLTQADSDESEDDLVLNLQQKNGGVKNGKSALGDLPEPDSDADVAGAAKPHLSEVTPEGFPSEPLGGLEQKATSPLVSYVRTSVFLLTLVISMVLVLLCAFLIPCPPRDLHSAWSRRLGSQGGGDLSPLELADVNRDGLRDVLLTFVTTRNGTEGGVGSQPTADLVCLSGMNGSTLWSSPLPEEAQDVTCLDLIPGSVAKTICLVTGTRKMLSAFNATSGKVLWTLNPNHLSNGTLAAPVVVLPDLDEDGVRDLVVLAIGELQPDLCFLLVSGRTGSPVGRPVKYNIVGVGNLIGPQVYITASGAVYILFGFGNIQAVALRDIFVQAQNRDSSPPSLQIEEPEWEKHRSVNLSELIDVYSDGVELLQLVKAPDSNSSSLLITTRQGLVLLRGQDLMPHWKLNLQGLRSQPTPGYFTDDQTLDFLLQTQDGDGMKKMTVVDGGSGSIVWSYSIPCHMKETPTTSAITSDQKSVFLFWAEALTAASLSSDDSSGAEPPGLYHLYLLHPAFPSILLDLSNTTGIVTASEVGINDIWKDAFYVTRTTGMSPEGHPTSLVVSKLSLRWALMEGQMVQLKETTPKIGRGELRRFLSRIKFVDSPYQI